MIDTSCNARDTFVRRINDHLPVSQPVVSLPVVDELRESRPLESIEYANQIVDDRSRELFPRWQGSVNGLQDNPSKYQISVPIQQGNSGGPLLNMRGEVVGMITAMLGEVGVNGGPAQPVPNIGYALKIGIIKQYLAQIAEPSVDIRELRPAASDLEKLAARVQDSVMIVMAE